VIAAGLALFSLHGAVAQQTPAATDNSSTVPDAAPCTSCETAKPAIFILNPETIMGFENPIYWSVQSSGKPYSNVQSTPLRTEGSAALAVTNPPSQISLTSQSVGSATTALAGIANSGAVLQLDLRLQPQGNPLVPSYQVTAETTNTGKIEAFVSSKSRSLNSVSLGTVSLQNLRSGIYNTISFTIPASVSSALKGATYSDLVFEFAISLPQSFAGQYLFDNLRVHSVELTQSPKGAAPPSGYGSSLDLNVVGAKPTAGSFTLSPIQIPAAFHLKLGTVGTTTVQLELGLDSAPQLTCTYVPDTTDKTAQSYILNSCTGGYVAGDLVNSNWSSLAILRGTSSQQLRAQLSVNPLGNLSGAGLIPPMPTYWGGSNTCAPTPVQGKVVTTSTSCKSQTAQANQIVTQYFENVAAAKPDGNWVVAPIPDSAVRSGDGTPFKVSTKPEVAANDLPFQTGGDLNPGGSFDAYWQLSGNLTPTAVAGTDENLTHFDADFTAHGVLFGDDVDMVDAKVTADTDSGETTPAYKPATSTGTLGFYVLGEEIPSGGLTFSPSTGFSIDPSWSQEYDLPSIQIWIFDITLGALVNADLKAQGSAALSGADLSVTPTASLGAHISGGINLGIADGEVDAKVNLVTLSAPTTAQVKWDLNTDPSICAAELQGSLNSNLNLGSGGGEVDLDATFGYCPFCYTDSWTLFKWNSLVNKSWTLFNDTLDTQLFALPGSMCKYSINASIVSPMAAANLSSGLPITLTGSATPTETTLPYTATYNWTYTKGANASTVTVNPAGANSANPIVTFGPPTSGNSSTWTIKMTATTTVRSAGGAVLTQTASAAPVTVTVNKLAPGDYLSISTQYNPSVTQGSNGVWNVGNAPGAITFSGIVDGDTSTPTTTFTIQPCTLIDFRNHTSCLVDEFAQPTVLTSVGGNTATPSAIWTGFSGGYFLVTMTTTNGSSTFSSASAIIYGTVIV
jgi:hypothetical protein